MSLLRAISPTTRAAVIIVILGLIPAAILFRMGTLYWPVYLSLAIILTLLALLAGRVIWNIKARPRLRNTLQGVWVSAISLIIVLMLLEAGCKLFVAWSDGFIVTLSEQNWLRRHWQPINSLGYRDQEWSTATLAGRTKILVVGDSTTAGAGLEAIQDRYQNVLGQMLGARYAVMTAAQIGWDSRQELAALESYPTSPDVVILAYSINDIDPVAAEHKIGVTPGSSLRDSPVFPLISTSYFLNFAYYSVLRLPVWHSDAAIRGYQQAAYADQGVWQEHIQTLRAFYEWSQAHHAQLIVMVLPDINAAAITSPYSRQVAQFFDGLGGATTLDLGPELSRHDARSMAVSVMDAHANAATHRLFALRLCPLVAQVPGLPPVSCPQSP